MFERLDRRLPAVFRFLLAAGAALTTLVTAPRDANAIPAFARRTGLGCAACHVSWPKLNDFGEAFRDRGYRVRDDNPDFRGRSLDYAPIAIRSTAAYQATSMTQQATDLGPKTVRTGGMLPPGADLLIGTSLSEHLSVFVVATGFADDGAVNLESDWARINDIGTSWANLKVGRHELDLPVSEHRTYTLSSDFLAYHYHPVGSANTFSIGDNQLGFEWMGHGEGPGLRYSVSILSAGDNPGSASAFSAPVGYAHVTWTTLPASHTLSRLRVGATANVGAWPTVFKTDSSGGAPVPVPGTGTEHKPFYTAGAEASVTLGPLARPLDVTAAWYYGNEDKGLFDPAIAGVRDASWTGGFLQVDYTPVLELTAYGRLDSVQCVQQADPAQTKKNGDLMGVTVGVRHALWISPWGATTLHVEANSTHTEGAGASPGSAVDAMTLLAGLDFAL